MWIVWMLKKLWASIEYWICFIKDADRRWRTVCVSSSRTFMAAGSATNLVTYVSIALITSIVTYFQDLFGHQAPRMRVSGISSRGRGKGMLCTCHDASSSVWTWHIVGPKSFVAPHPWLHVMLCICQCKNRDDVIFVYIIIYIYFNSRVYMVTQGIGAPFELLDIWPHKEQPQTTHPKVHSI